MTNASSHSTIVGCKSTKFSGNNKEKEGKFAFLCKSLECTADCNATLSKREPYRYMTQEEKNKVRYWFRMFKNSYTMKNFLKERKRKRDKEKSPLHPSYKEIETEIKEKDQKPPLSKEKKESGFEGLDDDQMGF